MKEFNGKVAVITGAASGIGCEIAARCAREGMKVVLADVEEKALIKAENELREAGATVLAVLTDVSKAEDVDALAQETIATFGAVHLLCNNAGVSGSNKPIWEYTLADWEWVMSVNLYGVIHGIRAFVPLMLAQDAGSHIVNTASVAGFGSFHSAGIYKVTKHGVVTLSETLFHDLAQQKANIGVSVLCPGFVNTNIYDSARNRPVALQNEPTAKSKNTRQSEAWKKIIAAGIPPQQVADSVFQAVKNETFYILTHPDEAKGMAHIRMKDILEERKPTDTLAGKGF